MFWERSGDLFSVHDSEGRFVDANPAWERVLGWRRDQLIGMPSTDLIHPDDLVSTEAVALAAAGDDGRLAEVECRYRCADGVSYRWLAWSAYTDGDGWCGVGKDVTERKAVEAARDTAQERAAEAHSLTGVSTWRWDPDADSMALTGQLEESRATMALPSTLEGTLRLLTLRDREELEQAVRRLAAREDESCCVRFEATVVDGQARWLEWRGAVILDERGGVEAVQGTTHDVTEAELAGLELLHSRDFCQATLDSLDARIAVLDEDGAIVSVNQAWTHFVYAEGAPLGVGKSYLGAWDSAADHEPLAAEVAEALRRVLAGELERYEVEYPCDWPKTDGWCLLQAVLHRADGPPRVLVLHHDITSRVQAGREQRVRAHLVDEVDAAVIATDLDGGVTHWSRGAEDLYGWTEEETLSQPLGDLLTPTVPDDRPTPVERTQEGLWDGELEVRRKDGSAFVSLIRTSVVGDEDGDPIGLVRISTDSTERAAGERELRRTRDYLAAVTENMGEALFALDSAGVVQYVNSAAERLLGFGTDELLGRNLHEETHYQHPDGSPYPIEDCPLVAARTSGRIVRVEDDVFYRRDGVPVSVDYTSAPFELEDGQGGTVAVLTDTTDRKRGERTLRASEAQLKAIIENTQAAIYIKSKGDYRYLLVNPEFESIIGLQPGTALGRRDEELLPASVVKTLREVDRRVIEENTNVSLEEEIPTAAGLRTYLTLKFPLRDEDGETYALCGISTDITERKQREAELEERVEWEKRIRTAVAEDALIVYTQPIIDLRSNELVQEELLVRMRGPAGTDEVILPGEFLPQAERFGLVGQVDRWMVRQGVELAARGRPVAINLSGRSLGDRFLMRQIERDLATSGADPSLIVFEITETAAVEDIEAARAFSERLASLGCLCALDDFGTGYGSLTYQRNLVVQFLKIDMSFVRNMADSVADQQVVKSIVQIARDFGQRTIAEGVQDEATLELLREFGVDHAQGSHIGRPAPLIPGHSELERR